MKGGGGGFRSRQWSFDCWPGVLSSWLGQDQGLVAFSYGLPKAGTGRCQTEIRSNFTMARTMQQKGCEGGRFYWVWRRAKRLERLMMACRKPAVEVRLFVVRSTMSTTSVSRSKKLSFSTTFTSPFSFSRSTCIRKTFSARPLLWSQEQCWGSGWPDTAFQVNPVPKPVPDRDPRVWWPKIGKSTAEMFNIFFD